MKKLFYAMILLGSLTIGSETRTMNGINVQLVSTSDAAKMMAVNAALAAAGTLAFEYALSYTKPFFTTQAENNATEQHRNYPAAKKILGLVTKYAAYKYMLNPYTYLSTGMHELGHAIPMCILQPGNFQGFVLATSATSGDLMGMGCIVNDHPTGIGQAIMLTGGPIAGSLASYAIIKSFQTIKSYTQQTDKSWKQAFAEARNTSIFDITGSGFSSCTFPCLLNIANNILNFLPFSPLDGSRLLDAFNLQSSTIARGLLITGVAGALTYGAYKIIKDTAAALRSSPETENIETENIETETAPA